MIKFLLKGILNDKGRSLLPIIVVTLGSMLTIFLHSWLTGVMGESIELSSNYNTGDVRVMTRAYAADKEQFPNDLAILDSPLLVEELKKLEPSVEWAERIRFGALADFPDSLGETRGQGAVVGWAVDLLGEGSKEPQRFNLQESLERGRLPEKAGECLLSEDLAARYGVSPGEQFTLFGTTMEGGFSFTNFIVSGTIRFGSPALDRGAVIADIEDIRAAFDMDGASGEILGFLPYDYFNEEEAEAVKSRLNAEWASDEDEFAPVAQSLRDVPGMADFLAYSNYIGTIMIFLFVSAMAIVLWNAGLLGGLRRYTEFGVRIALGEDKGHIYRSLLWEALMTGVIGSVIGTALGVTVVYALNSHGIDISGMMKNATMLMPSVMRPAVTPVMWYIGFIPGVFSMLLGNALAGIGIYKRETARLFNELEV